MPFINYIKVPFVTAYDIANYIESLGFSIFLSGSYAPTPVAVDDFENYLTGFNKFFSGSGYWLTSGTTAALSNYFTDDFEASSTGIKQFAALGTNFVYQGYNIYNGSTTGTIFIYTDVFYDDFEVYSTGTTNNYPSGYSVSGYNQNYSLTTGNSFIYQLNYTNSGSVTNNWIITNKNSIQSSGPFVGAGSLNTFQSSVAYIGYDPTYLLTNYTIEMWVYRSGATAANEDIFASNGATNPQSGIVIGWLPPSLNIYNSSEAPGAAQAGIIQAPVSYSFPFRSWVHIAMVKNTGIMGLTPSGINMYYSGILVTGQNSATNNSVQPASMYTGKLTSTNSFFLGSVAQPFIYIDNSAWNFTGYIAEFRLWNYPRSQTQIQNAMNSKVSPGAETGLLLYFSL